MSNEKNYYVLCGNNCRYPAMTKEQILAAITQAVETGEIQDVDTGFVTTIKEQNTGKGLKFWVGTQAQYNALETKGDDVYYIITDDTFEADIHAAIEEMQKETEMLADSVGAYINKTGVVLCSTGFDYGDCNIKVPNLMNYSIVKVQVGASYVLCNVHKTDATNFKITGLGTGTLSSNSVIHAFSCHLSGTFNGTTGTITSNMSASYKLWGTTGEPTGQSVIKIVGIM